MYLSGYCAHSAAKTRFATARRLIRSSSVIVRIPVLGTLFRSPEKSSGCCVYAAEVTGRGKPTYGKAHTAPRARAMQCRMIGSPPLSRMREEVMPAEGADRSPIVEGYRRIVRD